MLRLLRKPVRGTCGALRSDRQPLVHQGAWETRMQLRVMYFCNLTGCWRQHQFELNPQLTTRWVV